MSNKITLNIGFGNTVIRDEVAAVVQPNSAPVKRFIKKRNEESRVVDATMGKKLRAVILLKSDYIVLSAISVNAIVMRLEE